MAKKKQEWIKARVTHLEMLARPSALINAPSKPRLALMRVSNMPVSFYRYIYEQIGKPHHWYVRRVMKDDELLEIIRSENTHIEVLYADGSPAGFFELDKTSNPESIEIAYFGMLPDFHGLGLGKWFLQSAIQRAWDENPKKIIVHTNTLDHPAALRMYQKMGFSPFAVSEEEVTPWN